MAALVRVAPDYRTVIAAHVALQLMDRRCLRTPHDVERDGLMGVAAEAADLEIAVTGVEGRRPAQAMAAPVPCNRACACSIASTASQVGCLAGASVARSAAALTDEP